MNEKSMLNDIEIDPLLLESVIFEKGSIDDEFVRVPRDLAYWTEKCCDAKRQELASKQEMERVKAALHIEVRESTKDQGIKATIGDIEAKVRLHPDYQMAAHSLVDAESELARAKGRLDVIRAKKDVLSSLSAMSQHYFNRGVEVED